MQTKAGIVVHQSTFGIRRIELTDLVAGISIVAKRLIAMREAFWYVEGAAVFLVQLDGNVLKIGGAFRSEVHDDIEDRAPRAP